MTFSMFRLNQIDLLRLYLHILEGVEHFMSCTYYTFNFNILIGPGVAKDDPYLRIGEGPDHLKDSVGLLVKHHLRKDFDLKRFLLLAWYIF